MIVAVTAVVSSSAAGLAGAERRAAEQQMAARYDALLSSVTTFESEAQSAAQAAGPAGLAQYAIGHGDVIYEAALSLESAVQAADLPAGSKPAPALIDAAVRAGKTYGREVQLLADGLGACMTGDVGCYQAAFAASDATAGSGRSDLLSAVQAIRAARN